ncbi:MAG: hypothetical protein CEO19_181 [Parcubacteria group bacterium Gr01-1014_73]|nr:MAG: hypothetical protein CEO19_181 [Parcubacteria group bacterium Gr01-1014_73]
MYLHLSKHALIVLVAIAFSAANFSYAAYNDVSMSSPGQVTVSGVNLKIGPDLGIIERITVNSASLVVVLLANSILDITSSDRRTLTFSGLGTTETSSSCDSSQSRYSFSNPAGGSSATITITVDAGVCTGVSGGGVVVGVTGGGSGGGGGGGAIVVAVVTTTATTTPTTTTTLAQSQTPAITTTPVSGLSVTQINAIISLLQSFGADQSVINNVRTSLEGGGVVAGGSTGVGAAKGYTFTKPLKTGSNNTGVKQLQLILNSSPDTKIAVSGAGSPGNETNYYGSLTRKAVEKFQVKYGIAKSGDQGYGTVGPKTRAKLNELAK